MPAVQAQRMIIMRTANEYMAKGNMTRAVELTDKYFEGFPDMNFAYNATTIPFFSIYRQAGEMEKLKKHLSILVENTRQDLEFFLSLDEDVVNANFRSDLAYATQSVQDCISLAQATGDNAFLNEVNAKLSAYLTTRAPN
jgi:hypothetical protein